MTITDTALPAVPGEELLDQQPEPEPEQATAAESVRLMFVDPQELVLDENVRGDKPLDKRFVASIRDLGVLVPVSARRGEDGQLRVLLGRQRTADVGQIVGQKSR